MEILIDAFGGDNAPLEILKGCTLCLTKYEGVKLGLVGNKEIIEKTAAENNIALDAFEIFDAPDVITMEDDAGEIMKSKNNSSMAVGLKLLADGEGDAFLSAGNSGANVEVRPDMLQQFGIMGSIYMENVLKVKNPKVALANVGTEDHKGGELQHEAFRLLKASDINFVGNMEARDIPAGAADVIVADGFTGNIIIKMYEGVAKELFGKIKGIFFKNLKTKLAALLLKKELYALKQYFDYNQYGAAPVMGVAKPVLKTHGSAKADAVVTAVKSVIDCVNNDVTGKIAEQLASAKNKEGSKDA